MPWVVSNSQMVFVMRLKQWYVNFGGHLKCMCNSKDNGGAGLSGYQGFNMALLAKQEWRIVQDQSSMVAQTLKITGMSWVKFPSWFCLQVLFLVVAPKLFGELAFLIKLNYSYSELGEVLCLLKLTALYKSLLGCNACGMWSWRGISFTCT